MHKNNHTLRIPGSSIGFQACFNSFRSFLSSSKVPRTKTNHCGNTYGKRLPFVHYFETCFDGILLHSSHREHSVALRTLYGFKLREREREADESAREHRNTELLLD